MRFEVLHTEGCSGYEATEKNLRAVLAEGGVEAEGELVEVRTEDQAERLRFPGSPTLRLDGRDLFPQRGMFEGGAWRLG